MRKLIIIAAALSAALAAPQALAVDSLDELLQQVRQSRSALSAENQAREQRFIQNRNEQQALLQQAQQELAAAEARSNQLTEQFNANELQLAELNETLRLQLGNFGELFGVVRQVSGDTVGLIRSSLVTAQDNGREEVAERLAQVRGVPSMEELNDLRALLTEEMIRSGNVARFSATVTRPDGTQEEEELVRIGVFNLISGDRFFNYLPETQTILELARQPQARFRNMAENLFNASPNTTVATAVDPGRGSLLALLIQEPSLAERIDQGGLVGYVIIALGIVGLLIALVRWLYLGAAGARIRGQLKSADQPNEKNPLGRILKVYDDNRDVDTETLELKLDEAILKEVPKLETWQGAIKVIAAVAPLLGLLGTVTGMIVTFQAITLFGTGDPKLMAGGISQALVTTVLGLTVAIPLVLLHSVVASRSKALIEVLEEQSAGIIAKQAEGGR
ncbi:MotA/TolQ/ExbB proton channel family protein [Thioalkalivibrio sp. XN279]|uniref:MotA/TolQ/ExbB proton channel family protein n=1 Tax=Thioalkalivibrio sp. XN279 TaxID=2714953 RepID=UPI001F0FE849|nr:MotA/TolQ/ExbB proton channel family protein [Thioalkalivibrio sp. XN279]